jgi:ABC-2 type transport system ATP-binding protein
MPIPALRLSALSKSFGKPAVDHLSLAIAPGEFYALLGPNGAGKTTTLRMIAGLTAPDSGAVELFGIDMARAPEQAKRALAYVPDDPPLYGKLTPLEYLEFVGGLWSLPAADCAARGEALLRTLGLWENAQQRCEEFSRGMKQKVALAGALVHTPQLLLLDEPLTGLDAHAARLVKDMLLAFVAAGGTIVLTTHILEVAERLAQRIGIIQRGRLIAEGTLDQLRARAGETQGTLEDVFLELTAAPE